MLYTTQMTSFNLYQCREFSELTVFENLFENCGSGWSCPDIPPVWATVRLIEHGDGFITAPFFRWCNRSVQQLVSLVQRVISFFTTTAATGFAATVIQRDYCSVDWPFLWTLCFCFIVIIMIEISIFWSILCLSFNPALAIVALLLRPSKDIV